MTAIVFVSIGVAFILGIRGAFFAAMALVTFAIAAIQFAAGHHFGAIAYAVAMQVAYMSGLLVNAMRR